MSNMIHPGARFHHLKFIGFVDARSKDHHLQGEWLCDCGETKVLANTRVIHGQIKHCGCLYTPTITNFKHGMRYTRTYATWAAIKQRCLNAESKDFKRYGHSGISLCNEWANSFESFLSDMGERPLGTSIDRIDTTKGYEPNNCRWATPSQQQRNKTTSYTWHIKGSVFESIYEAASFNCVSTMTVQRWVEGYFDSRRDTFKEKRDDCWKIPRY